MNEDAHFTTEEFLQATVMPKHADGTPITDAELSAFLAGHAFSKQQNFWFALMWFFFGVFAASATIAVITRVALANGWFC